MFDITFIALPIMLHNALQLRPVRWSRDRANDPGIMQHGA